MEIFSTLGGNFFHFLLCKKWKKFPLFLKKISKSGNRTSTFFKKISKSGNRTSTFFKNNVIIIEVQLPLFLKKSQKVEIELLK